MERTAVFCALALFFAQPSLPQAPSDSPELTAASAALSAAPTNSAAQEDYVEAAVRQALEARGAGDPDRALATLLHARERLPHSPTLLLDFALQADAMRLYRDADIALTELVGIQPTDPPTLYALARVKLDEGKLPEAEPLFRRYLALKPDDATAHYGLGRVLHEQVRDEDAEREFTRSLQLQPAQTESAYELGSIAIEEHRDADAQARFDAVIARNPSHPGALAGLGTLALRRKQYGDAVDLLKRSLTLAPGYPETHRSLALALAKLGRKEESEQELATAAHLTEEQDKTRGGLVIQQR